MCRSWEEKKSWIRLLWGIKTLKQLKICQQFLKDPLRLIWVSCCSISSSIPGNIKANSVVAVGLWQENGLKTSTTFILAWGISINSNEELASSNFFILFLEKFLLPEQLHPWVDCISLDQIVSFWLLYGKIVSTVCLWHLDKHIPTEKKKWEKIGIRLQQGGSRGWHSTVCLRCVWDNDQLLTQGTSLAQAHTVVGDPCQQPNPHPVTHCCTAGWEREENSKAGEKNKKKLSAKSKTV